jgi:uncharacterized membrane protein YeiB
MQMRIAQTLYLASKQVAAMPTCLLHGYLHTTARMCNHLLITPHLSCGGIGMRKESLFVLQPAAAQTQASVHPQVQQAAHRGTLQHEMASKHAAELSLTAKTAQHANAAL